MSSTDGKYGVLKTHVDVQALTKTNRTITRSVESYVGSPQIDDKTMQHVYQAAKHSSIAVPLPQFNHTHNNTDANVKICSINASRSDSDVSGDAGYNVYTNVHLKDEVHGKEELGIGQHKRDTVKIKAKKICRKLRTSAAVSIGLALLGERIFDFVASSD
jgi:hypothetical protein